MAQASQHAALEELTTDLGHLSSFGNNLTSRSIIQQVYVT